MMEDVGGAMVVCGFVGLWRSRSLRADAEPSSLAGAWIEQPSLAVGPTIEIDQKTRAR